MEKVTKNTGLKQRHNGESSPKHWFETKKQISYRFVSRYMATQHSTFFFFTAIESFISCGSLSTPRPSLVSPSLLTLPRSGSSPHPRPLVAVIPPLISLGLSYIGPGG
ncbi:hypothetical protein RRG08_016053 [Elysia crispata]|uniref:Uncharacterized protein n=1 Tax=Elysia crispata TaxID=231223 RepID=A0AAE0ZNH8_9GAST|nr:hypothetical protein RRG08_016053 [Elysia crispata]